MVTSYPEMLGAHNTQTVVTRNCGYYLLNTARGGIQIFKIEKKNI